MGSRFKFDFQKEQSAVKTAIVTKYFAVWSKIMKKQCKKMGYIDLYSGPGKYEDGTYSTPIIILKHIMSDNELAEKVVTYFNDKDEECYKNLKDNIDSLEGIDKLKFYPQVENKEVNQNTADYFGKKHLIPCFSFIDPAGYCGLSMDLIQALGKDYGSDLIFFFNYNDINRGLTVSA